MVKGQKRLIIQTSSADATAANTSASGSHGASLRCADLAGEPCLFRADGALADFRCATRAV
jgi:hypothetical protein